MSSTVADRARVVGRRIRRNLSDAVAIDTRTLAVFRVFLGLLIIADVLLRLRNFSFYYADSGAVPRSLAMDATADTAISVFYLSTSPAVTLALFGVGTLVACQLIVGYRTTLATVLSLIFVVSVDHLNPFVLSYADTLFRLLLFWAIFLPLGERWSIDAVHTDSQPRAAVASVASALILSQMVYMYFMNWYHKYGDELWTSGEATPLIMGLDDTTFLLGEFTRNFPTLLQYGGLGWYYMLAFSWLLIFLAGRKRMLFVGMFMAGHASFALTVRIGAFAYVAIAGLTLFLQAQFWDDLEALRRRLDIDRSWLDDRAERLAALGATVPYYRIESDRAARLRSGIYTGGIATVVGVMLIMAAGAASPAVDDRLESSGVDDQIENGADSLAISQPSWTVFAPSPRTVDRYYVFPATTANGDRVDLYNSRELTFDRPYDALQKQYGSYRERFYMGSIRSGGVDDRHDAPHYLAEHLCAEWTEQNDSELTHINMYQVSEYVTNETIDDHESRNTRTRQLYQHGCGDSEPTDIDISEP